MARIFLNYRREDASGYAGRIFDSLKNHFGADQIFMDVDTLQPGVDFVDEIERAVGSCDVLITVIGRNWANLTDAEGNRRLEDPADFVRLEVSAALKRDIPVIPALVQGAKMPSAAQLPDTMQRLARRNAIEISDHRFSYDMDRLIRAVESVVGKPNGKKLQIPGDSVAAPGQPAAPLIGAPAVSALDAGNDPGPATGQVPNYLIWSIISTICCCLVTGIVAIIYSSKVNTEVAKGNLQDARKASDQARMWNIISIVVGLIVAVIYIAIYSLVIIGELDSYTY